VPERELELRATAWKWSVEREKRAKVPETLAVETWTRASRTWASVTPVVLHHYPKKNRDADVERIVREAFASALLPEPVAVEIRPVCWFRGVGHAKALPEYEEGGANLCRYQVHAVAHFAQKVQGPMLVGRGRSAAMDCFAP
jgi:CRISPR-associated protein Csb2